MSRRSYDSVAHEKRVSKYRVTDDDLFECVPRSHKYVCLLIPPQLRPPCSVSCACLSYLCSLQLKHQHSILSYITSPKVVAAHANGSETKEKEHHSKISGAISHSIVSIGDIFKEIRDGSKSVKFPEKLLKVLEQKLQNIAMGKEAACVAQLSRG